MNILMIVLVLAGAKGCGTNEGLRKIRVAGSVFEKCTRKLNMEYEYPLNASCAKSTESLL